MRERDSFAHSGLVASCGLICPGDIGQVRVLRGRPL